MASAKNISLAERKPAYMLSHEAISTFKFTNSVLLGVISVHYAASVAIENKYNLSEYALILLTQWSEYGKPATITQIDRMIRRRKHIPDRVYKLVNSMVSRGYLQVAGKRKARGFYKEATLYQSTLYARLIILEYIALMKPADELLRDSLRASQKQVA